MSTTTADSPAATHWFLAVLMGAAVIGILVFMPMEWVVDINAPNFNPLVLVPAVLGVIGAYELAQAIRWTRRGQRFGEARLALDGSGTVRMGGRMKGRVQTTRQLQPTGDFVLTLQCVEVHEFRSSSRRPDVTHDRAAVAWEATVRVPPGGVDTTRGIPFAFELPEKVREAPAPHDPNAPTTAFKAAISIPGMKTRVVGSAAPSATRWQLVVSAPMPGTDFSATFPVSVEPRA